jgi:hypothetical protein
MTRATVNPNDPIGSMGSVQDEILNGVLGGLDYDPQAARGDLFIAANLISDSYTRFSNQCAKTTENKKANRKTHDLFRPAQIAAA